MTDSSSPDVNMGIEVNTYPKDSFHQTLNEIANHRFVTKDTLIYREVMKIWMKDLKEGFEILGVTECVFVPTGSVAVGMVSAEAGSDIDGKLLYRAANNLEFVNEFVNKVKLPEKFNPFLVFSEITHAIERTAHDSELALEHNNSSYVDEEAKLFAPSLLEFDDPEDREAIDSWRREVIQKLADLPDNKGETVWNLMCEVLERQFVHYENSEGGDSDKRKTRVENVITDSLNKTYGEDEKRKSLAKAVVDKARNDFHYPDFEEMKNVFLKS